jgi:hypothetical protein
MNERVEHLNMMINEGRVIRNAWTGLDEQGRETACLLAALAPEVAEAEDSGACPASVMPGWFADLTPWIDDEASEAEWSRMVRRYAACAARWSLLDNAAWRRVEIASRRASVVEAMSHTTQEGVLDACREALAWLGAGMPEQSRKQLRASLEAVARAATKAESAARAAAWAGPDSEAPGAWAAARAARAARAAAAAAVGAAATSAEAEAEAAAEAAAWAAAAVWSAADWAAAAAEARAESEVGPEAQAEAADRITAAILTALERECGLNQKEEA